MRLNTDRVGLCVPFAKMPLPNSTHAAKFTNFYALCPSYQSRDSYCGKNENSGIIAVVSALFRDSYLVFVLTWVEEGKLKHIGLSEAGSDILRHLSRSHQLLLSR